MRTPVQTTQKPWGKEELWAKTEKYLGKILHVKAGNRLSKQYHEVKEETIFVLQGTLKLEVWDSETDSGKVHDLVIGESFHIPPRTIHRFGATTEDVALVEVSSPEIDDVRRIEDDYGRVP